MVDPNNSFWLSTTKSPVIRDTACEQITERSETRGCHIGCSTTNKRSVAIDRSFNPSSDIVLNGLSLAARLDYANLIDIPTFDDVMNEVMTPPVFTVVHIPKSVCSLIADVLSGEFRLCVRHSILGMVRLFAFAKSVLRVPHRGGKTRRHVIKSLFLSCIKQWQIGDMVSLWLEARNDASRFDNKSFTSVDVGISNARRAIRLAREGRYIDAVRSLSSEGCADHNNSAAYEELLSRHPDCQLADCSYGTPPSLVVESKDVLSSLLSFPKGSSPGGSQLRAQHLLNAICCTIAPAAQFCLDSLTVFMNNLVAGKLPTCIAPCLVGALLTAVKKKNGGYKPIAVDETIRRLASRLCCAATKPHLEELLLLYGQIGVTVKGGLEAAVHTVRSFISCHSSEEDL